MRAVANETRNLLLGVDRTMKSTVSVGTTSIFIHRSICVLQRILLTVIHEFGHKSDQSHTQSHNPGDRGANCGPLVQGVGMIQHRIIEFLQSAIIILGETLVLLLGVAAGYRVLKRELPHRRKPRH
jgi:hypothetical protein